MTTYSQTTQRIKKKTENMCEWFSDESRLNECEMWQYSKNTAMYVWNTIYTVQYGEMIIFIKEGGEEWKGEHYDFSVL